MNALKAMLEKQAQAKALAVGESTVPAAPTSAAPPAAPKAGLSFLKNKPASASVPPTVPPVTPPQVADHVLSLDDIGESVDEGLEPARTVSGPAFPDEVPATAPVRELPEELTTQQLEFVQQLDSVYEIVHDPELFGQFVRTIMSELQEHPDYIKIVADSDVHVMIRGLRSSMGLARVKKVEKSTKARGTKQSKVAGVAEIRDQLSQMFGDDAWT